MSDPGPTRPTGEVADLYARFTRPGPEPGIKASMLERFIKSPITVWCELHVDKSHRDPPNDYQELLFKRGNQHQAEVTNELFGTSVSESFRTEEEGFIRVLQLMTLGADAIGDMPVLCRPLGLEGRPDIVRRVDGQASVFGNHAYEIVEIKSARNIKRHHILQAALYNRALGEVQGVEPAEFHLVNGDTEQTSYAAADYASDLDEAIAGLRKILSGASVPPVYGGAMWPWQGHIDGLAIKIGDASIVPGVGASTRDRLGEIGLLTVQDLASADPELLKSVKGIGASKAARMGSAARAIRDNTVVTRAPVARMRLGATEVFIDLEGSTPELSQDGIATVNYLIGCLVRGANGDPSSGRFVPFFADRPDGEAANTRDFFAWAADLPDPVFYHWHSYERTHLTAMAGRFSVPDDQAEFVLGRLVDLSPLTTSAFAFPTHGEGLKDIAKYLGFEWRQDDVNALASVALYSQWVESDGTDETAKRKILDYNEDDCRATMVVCDWLRGAAQAA
jgi:predicted RecB family nuclease